MVLHSVPFQKQHVPGFWQPGNVVQGKAKEPTTAQSLEDLRRNDFFSSPKSNPHLSFITPFCNYSTKRRPSLKSKYPWKRNVHLWEDLEDRAASRQRGTRARPAFPQSARCKAQSRGHGFLSSLAASQINGKAGPCSTP